VITDRRFLRSSLSQSHKQSCEQHDASVSFARPPNRTPGASARPAPRSRSPRGAATVAAAIDYKGITIAPMGLTVSQYFSAIAFEATPPAKEGGRQLKLVNQKTPENSKIALGTPNGDLFLPTDTSLDGRLFPGSKRAGVIAFEAFTDALDSFEIVLDVAADAEPVRINVRSPTLHEQTAAELAAESVVGQFLADLRSKQVEMKASADRARDQLARQARAGCAVLLVVTAGALLLAMSVALSL
jgi:hypothetical protein